MSRFEHRKLSPMECLASRLSSNQTRNVVTIAGAGISTSAGICDWRSPKTGLYYNLKKYKVQYVDVLFDKHHFLNNPDVLYSVLRDNFVHKPLKPTLTHCFIKLLEEKGVLLRHFTQNIDGMELMTGILPEKVVEAHGTLQRSYCVKCKTQYDYQWFIKKIEDEPTPLCESCGGLVRPDIVMFGEELSQNFHLRKFVDLPECDLLIVFGTSLQVEPFASLILEAPPECPRLVINRSGFGNINSGKNPQDPRSRAAERESEEVGNEFILSADCDTAVQELVKLIGWEEDFRKVIRDVKLRKLHGDVRSVEVGVQTLPLLTDRESSFIPVESPIRDLRCSDFRRESKTKLSSERVKSRLTTSASPIKPIINVEPQMKPKIRRSKTKPNVPNENRNVGDGFRSFCDYCHTADCGSKHYSTYRK